MQLEYIFTRKLPYTLEFSCLLSICMQYEIPIFYQILADRKILGEGQILEKKLIIEKKCKHGFLIMKTDLGKKTNIRRRIEG